MNGEPRDPSRKVAEELVASVQTLDAWRRALGSDEPWSKIEQALSSLNVGPNVGYALVELTAPIPDPTGNDILDSLSEPKWLFGYRKIGETWRICFGCGPAVDPPSEHPWSWTPITECDLEIRIKAAKALGELLAEIARMAQDSEIEKALGSLQQASFELNKALKREAP